MKKIISLLLICAMVLSLAACGKKPAATTTTTVKKTEAATKAPETSKAPATTKPAGTTAASEVGVADVFRAARSGVYATISIDSSSVKLKEDAWLGAVPTGKNYITELEADEVDLIWFQVDARLAETDPYVFACDFEPIPDGSYAIVVANTDEADGYIVLQLSMEKKGGELKFDFTDAQLKERPAK